MPEQVLKQENSSFRLNNFPDLPEQVRKALIFNEAGEKVSEVWIRDLKSHDIIRFNSASGGIFLLEVIDPEKRLAWICRFPSPFLVNLHNLCDSLGECLVDGLLSRDESFTFVRGETKVATMVHRVTEVRILEKH